MIPKLYPPAIHKMDGSGSGEWSGIGEWKLVIHTTETRGVPGYKDGALAPHITYWPDRRTWTQHSDLRRPAESVRVHDDDQIYQLEIVCYSSKSTARRVGGLWVGELTDTHLEDIAAFPRWLMEQGLPLQPVWPGRQALSYSESAAAGFRFSPVAFFDFPGILGHQHLPANVHWDPGAFDWDRFMQFVGKDNAMGHPYESHEDYVADHDIGEVPDWSPWDEYVEAGGTTRPDSGTWPFTRADAAWFWNKWIRPLQVENAALRRKIDELAERPPGSGPSIDEIVDEIRRRLSE